jgi:hypothetical protein
MWASVRKSKKLIEFFFFHTHPHPHHTEPSTAQINFERRLGTQDVGNNCRMTVNGADFCIPQMGAAMKGNTFASHKYAGKFALRYKLGIDIFAGNLVWIQGPYPAGKYMDIKFSTRGCGTSLSPASGSRPTRQGLPYRGHTDKVKCPAKDSNPAEKKVIQGRVRTSHEMLNG